MTNVLHLYGNWKWTGPTELAVHLAESQTKAGARARIAFGRQRGGDDHFTKQVARRAVERVEGFELAKHFEPRAIFGDARRLAKLLREDPPDVIHCHLRSDHLVAALGRRISGRRVPIVRSTYEHYGPGPGLRERACITRATDALIVSSSGARDAVARLGWIDAARVHLVEPAIDTERFRADRPVADARQKLGLAPDAFVLGIVARVQARRRFDVFLEAAKRLCARDPRARVVILGGGTHQNEVAREPARQMGIGDRVLFPGVLRADEYVAALRTFSVKVYLVPGTDGTCRAVKEAMTSGIPVIAAREGMLPELVKHEETGLLFDGSADALDAAVERLRGDAESRRRLGDAASREAVSRWSREPMRQAIDAVYRAVGSALPASRVR